MRERPYSAADLLGVIETYTASIRGLAPSYYSPRQIDAWAVMPFDLARWQERLASLHTIVAESEGIIAGFASCPDVGYLDFLFTHPSFARRGVASKLYLRVESELVAAGVGSVTTHASLAARSFSTTTASSFSMKSASNVEVYTWKGLPWEKI